jgi:hypothetical protein
MSQVPNSPGSLGTTGPPQPIIPVPPGVQVSSGRETSMLGPNNQTVPGMAFNVTLPSGTVTTVFVPYALINKLDQVGTMIANRVAAIQRVEGLGTTS